MSVSEIIKGAIKQIWSSRLFLIRIYTPGILIFLGAGILSQIIPHLTIPELVGDVADIGEIPFYSGAISQLGLLLWSSATTLCFFTFFALRKKNGISKQTLNLLLSSGLLTGYLMLDDTYMLHDEFFPVYLKIVPEQVVLIILGLSMLAFLFFNRNEILQGDYGLILLAYLFFGISIAFDSIPRNLYSNIYFLEKIEHLIEDGSKFTAIVTWVTYYARYSYQHLSRYFSQGT